MGSPGQGPFPDDDAALKLRFLILNRSEIAKVEAPSPAHASALETDADAVCLIVSPPVPAAVAVARAAQTWPSRRLSQIIAG